MIGVGRPTLAVSPKNGTKSDLRRSEIKKIPGGHVCHVPHPQRAHFARFMRTLEPPFSKSQIRHCNIATVLQMPLAQVHSHTLQYTNFILSYSMSVYFQYLCCSIVEGTILVFYFFQITNEHSVPITLLPYVERMCPSTIVMTIFKASMRIHTHNILID